LNAPAAQRLDELGRLLAAAPSWEAPVLETSVREWTEKAGIKMKDVAQPARVAITGRGASPPLFDVMVVLGPARTLGRLARGADLARQG
jgi:glutamyl-tRNA synthetase